MLTFVPWTREHLLRLDVQASQFDVRPMMVLPGVLDHIEESQLAFSAIAPDGAVVACGGMLPIWPGRGQAWGIVGAMPRRAWPLLTDTVTEVLDAYQRRGWRRLETTTDPARPEQTRWAVKLGFELETLAPAYTQDGRATNIWRRIRLPASDTLLAEPTREVA